MGYDRRFRQRAVATHTLKWANIDTTLWSLAFASRGAATRCRFCFSTAHDSRNCEVTNYAQSSLRSFGTFERLPHQNYSPGRRFCFEWNESPSPKCSRPNCTYEHICYLCGWDPAVTSKHHKALNCYKWKPGVNQKPSP